jgi:hypothetical protein
MEERGRRRRPEGSRKRDPEDFAARGSREAYGAAAKRVRLPRRYWPVAQIVLSFEQGWLRRGGLAIPQASDPKGSVAEPKA